MRIVITGSSSGIGRALAEHLLKQGHQIWGLARSVQDELSAAYPAQFRQSTCDVADWSRVEEVAGEVAAAWEGVEGLVTCAGLQGAVGRTVDLDPFAWSATVRTNLDGTFYAIRAFHALLGKAAHRSKVVCFSGGGATKPRPNFSAYGVAKAGVVRLVETLAEEMQGEAIDLNSVAPGAINTRLTEEVLRLGPAVVGAAEYAAAVKQKNTGGASLERVLGLVDFLLSGASDGISGKLISAPWDPWERLAANKEGLRTSDVYTLRRIVPEERGLSF